MEESTWDIHLARKNLIWFLSFTLITTFLYNNIKEINILNSIIIEDLKWYEIFIVLLITLAYFVLRFRQQSIKSKEYNNCDNRLLLYYFLKALDIKSIEIQRINESLTDNNIATLNINKYFQKEEEEENKEKIKASEKVLNNSKVIGYSIEAYNENKGKWIYLKKELNIEEIKFNTSISWNIIKIGLYYFITLKLHKDNITLKIQQDKWNMVNIFLIYLKYYFSENYYTDFKLPFLLWIITLVGLLIKLIYIIFSIELNF